jgi:hypothetical protein
MPISEILSTDQVVLELNTQGAGNKGDEEVVLKPGAKVQEAWYSLVDNIEDLSKFHNITVRPDTTHKDTILITWLGHGAPALLRIRVYGAF